MFSKEYKLIDYKILDFFIEHVFLELDLTQQPIQSTALLQIKPNPKALSNSQDLHLDFFNMTLKSLMLNERILTNKDYELFEHALIIKNVPQNCEFNLETITLLHENPDLFGLYETAGTVLVKAETEGLRRVLPFIDRPDNLTKFTTKIIARKNQYPTLLANGVLIHQEELANGIHSVIWNDVIPKASYLFAMVAGNLECSMTSHTTHLGRVIPIEFHLPAIDIPKCTFAKNVLKAAMQWDELFFKLECILPQYMVAGVNQYASGASEPLGLNLFNTQNLLCTPASRTDNDILRILEVVSHEYFHTWTGDLVTIRDWFNLAAKEGLTTLRASLFIEYWLGIDLERLFSGYSLDARAPMPDKYTAVRSLYTAAAYEKSSEIFRMIMHAINDNANNSQAFFNALNKFLLQNIGNAITLENILDALSTSSGKNVKNFLNWFTKTGIPKITVTDEYNAQTRVYKLKFITKDGQERPIPVNTALLDDQGHYISICSTLLIDKPQMIFEYQDVPSQLTPSLLRGFSAPIYLEYEYTNKQLLLLMHHENDTYIRHNAIRLFITRMIKDYCYGVPVTLSTEFIAVYHTILNDKDCKKWLLAELFDFPTEEFLIANLPSFSFEKIAAGRQLIQNELAKNLQSELHLLIEQLESSNTSPTASDLSAETKFDSENNILFDIYAAGNRRLKAVCYSYLLCIEPKEIEAILVKQFEDSLSKNMTETVSALTLLTKINSKYLDGLLECFYQYWQEDIDAINYWFFIQISAHTPNVVKQVERLMQHPAFDLTNPNKVYAVLGAFIKNPYGFHALSGAGYQLVADTILKLEHINPTVAANLTDTFNSWKQYDEKRQILMHTSLMYIKTHAQTADVKNMIKLEFPSLNV